MIEVKIEPRKGDRLYEIHVGVPGEALLVSHQGYENASDAERIARRLFGPARTFTEAELEADPELVTAGPEPIDLTVTYRDGKGKHEMIR